MIILVPLVGRMTRLLDREPLAFVKLGKPCISFDVSANFGQIDPVHDRQCLPINFGAADDKRLFITGGELNRFVQAVRNECGLDVCALAENLCSLGCRWRPWFWWLFLSAIVLRSNC